MRFLFRHPDMVDARHLKMRRRVVSGTHIVVLVLSLLLIVYISYDTFANINFLENRDYMTFQFWVCVAFLASFFLELSFTVDRRGFARSHWFFLLVSIPYLNIINMFHIDFSAQALYYIRFIPLIRGAYSMAMVVGAFSSNRAFSILSQYLTILLSMVYMASLIFFYEERNINSNVLSYWDALYWACMNVTTIGSYITAISAVGRILGVLLGAAGMMMLPLFTVYITAKVKDYNDRKTSLMTIFDPKRDEQPAETEATEGTDAPSAPAEEPKK